MKQFFLLLALLILTCLAFAQERNLKLVKAPTENPTGQKRKAIVIGMSDYGSGRSLPNALNDADDMTDVFTRLGFEVMLLKNNETSNLFANIADWYDSIDVCDMAVFYFSGHGFEIEGQNYLIPVNTDFSSQSDIRFNTLEVSLLLDVMEEIQAGMKLIILDACHHNHYVSVYSGYMDFGFTAMTASQDACIIFSSSPGMESLNGRNYNLHNSILTHFLKQEFLKPGATLNDIINNVSKGVSGLTDSLQTPFVNSSLTKDFYFLPPLDAITSLR